METFLFSARACNPDPRSRAAATASMALRRQGWSDFMGSIERFLDLAVLAGRSLAFFRLIDSKAKSLGCQAAVSQEPPWAPTLQPCRGGPCRGWPRQQRGAPIRSCLEPAQAVAEDAEHES